MKIYFKIKSENFYKFQEHAPLCLAEPADSVIVYFWTALSQCLPFGDIQFVLRCTALLASF